MSMGAHSETLQQIRHPEVPPPDAAVMPPVRMLGALWRLAVLSTLSGVAAVAGAVWHAQSQEFIIGSGPRVSFAI
jgi:hypothetical protein